MLGGRSISVIRTSGGNEGCSKAPHQLVPRWLIPAASTIGLPLARPSVGVQTGARLQPESTLGVTRRPPDCYPLSLCLHPREWRETHAQRDSPPPRQQWTASSHGQMGATVVAVIGSTIHAIRRTIQVQARHPLSHCYLLLRELLWYLTMVASP